MHRIYFLKPGNHTDAVGSVDNYSISDLKEIRDSYSPGLFESPIVIGHNEDINAIYKNDTAPSYGWVKKIGLDNKGLYADAELNPQFEKLISNDVPPYKYVSAGIYEENNDFNPRPGKKYLRHIAFLGGTPPAIKGLPEHVKLYKESTGINTLELFNIHNSIEKSKKMKKELKKYEEINEVVFPASDSATEEILAFLNENSFDFISYILTSGEQGYPGEISYFDQIPSPENNYLYDTDTQSFSGIFYDDTSSEVDGFNFEIKNNGGSWTYNYSPVNTEETGDLNSYGEEAEEEELAPVQESELSLESQDEDQLASGKLEEEYSMSETEILRKELELLKNELKELKLKEYRSYSEKFSSLVSNTESVAYLLYELDINKGEKTTKIYSEKVNNNPVELIKSLLEEALINMAKVKSRVVTYGEFKPDETDEEDGPMDIYAGVNPIGTIPSEEGIIMHKKVLEYCQKNNLNPKKATQYLEAYKAVSG